MLDRELSLSTVLSGLEGVLKIEYVGDAKVDDVINAAIGRLEDTYGLTFDRDVYSIQSESQLSADSINHLLREIQSCLEQLSFYINLKLYHKNYTLTLSDINYLGYSKKQLLTSLKYLQDANAYKKRHDSIIKPLSNALNNIGLCTNKRLFYVLLMLDRLGITEGVSIVAQLLYLGGLIV